MEQNTLVFIILLGIPCSGKSTWAEKEQSSLYLKYGNCPVTIISRDKIRDCIGGKNYVFSKENEEKVTRIFFNQLSAVSHLEKGVVILDNTHVKEHYINSYFITFKSLLESGKAKIFIKVFDTNYFVCLFRNVMRRIKTGKWIPIKDMKRMYANFSSLNLEKYKLHFYD